MKTFTRPQIPEIDRKWYLINAEWLTIWKIAVKAADLLRWRNSSDFVQYIDNWSNVIIINIDKVKITWKKLRDKLYYTHSWYAKDWLKITRLEELNERKPTEAMRLAIEWMIPNNKLKKFITKRMKLFTWSTHEHEAQQPQEVKII